MSRRHTINITYSGPNVQSPVFVAGGFTDPPWQPHELYPLLTLPPNDDNLPPQQIHASFSRSFEVEEGQWQYKFRLGNGDWWVCDQGEEMTTDEHGNQNNVLTVDPPSKTDIEEKNAPTMTAAKPQAEGALRSLKSGSLKRNGEFEGVETSSRTADDRSAEEILRKVKSRNFESGTHFENTEAPSHVAMNKPVGESLRRLRSRSSERSSGSEGPETLGEMALDQPVHFTIQEDSTCSFDSSLFSIIDRTEILGGTRHEPLNVEHTNIGIQSTENLGVKNGEASAVEQAETTSAILPPSSLGGSSMYQETEVVRRSSMPNIGELSYIMKMPENADGTGSDEIMAYQDNKLYRLSPDYTHAVEMSTKTSECPSIDDEFPLEEPLLPHERLSNTHEQSPRFDIVDFESRHNSIIPRSATADDMNDPELQTFPDGREGILKRMRTLKAEIPQNNSSAVDTESPISNRRGIFDHQPQPTPTLEQHFELDGTNHSMRELRSHSISSYRTVTSRIASASGCAPGESDNFRRSSTQKLMTRPEIPLRKSSSRSSSISSAKSSTSTPGKSRRREDRLCTPDMEARGLISPTPSADRGEDARKRWIERFLEWLKMIWRKLVSSTPKQKQHLH